MVEFDPAKGTANKARHGVSLAEAERFDWETALVLEDRSEAYGEQRLLALGLIDLSVHMMVFTMRGDAVRVISLRRATRAESRKWAN